MAELLRAADARRPAWSGLDVGGSDQSQKCALCRGFEPARCGRSVSGQSGLFARLFASFDPVWRVFGLYGAELAQSRILPSFDAAHARSDRRWQLRSAQVRALNALGVDKVETPHGPRDLTKDDFGVFLDRGKGGGRIFAAFGEAHRFQKGAPMRAAFISFANFGGMSVCARY